MPVAREDVRISHLRVLSRFFVVLCVAGFSFQVYNVSRAYFLFQTSAQIVNTVPPRTLSPNIVLCVRYTDVLMYSKLEQETGIQGNRSSRFWDVVVTQSKLTVAQIMDYTPAATGLIASASIRTKDSYNLKQCSGKECAKEWLVSKFLLQEYICYRFLFRAPYVVDMDMTTFAPMESHLLFRISLSSKLSLDADLFKVIVYTGELPSLSKDYAPTVNRMTDFDTRTIESRTFTFSYIGSEVKLKARPYDTACEPSLNRSAPFLDLCLRQKMRPIARVPFTGILTDKLNIKHLNYFDLRDKRIAESIARWEQECRQAMSRPPCKFEFTITSLQPSEQGTQTRGNFSLVVRVPSSPGIHVTMDAKVTLSEYIIFVCSCVGFWFGVSVWSLNPLKLCK